MEPVQAADSRAAPACISHADQRRKGDEVTSRGWQDGLAGGRSRRGKWALPLQPASRQKAGCGRVSPGRILGCDEKAADKERWSVSGGRCVELMGAQA